MFKDEAGKFHGDRDDMQAKTIVRVPTKRNSINRARGEEPDDAKRP